MRRRMLSLSGPRRTFDPIEYIVKPNANERDRDSYIETLLVLNNERARRIS